jgi:hypothetical protein
MVLMDDSAQDFAAPDLRPGNLIRVQSGIERLKPAAPLER